MNGLLTFDMITEKEHTCRVITNYWETLYYE